MKTFCAFFVLTFLAFFVLTVPAPAQHAVVSNFSNPLIKGVTIGTRRCFLWFRSATLLGQYDFEGACYGPGAPALQFLPKGDMTSANQTWNFPGGAVGWLIQPLPDGTIKWSLEFKGPDDRTETEIGGVL